MKSVAVLLVLVAVASATQTVPTSDKNTIVPFASEVQPGNLIQVTQNVQDQFHQAQQMGYNGPQITRFLLNQGYPRTTVVDYLVQQYEAGLNQPSFQQQGVQQQWQGVSQFNVQFTQVQLQRVMQYVQTALRFLVNGQVSNQYVLQQLQQVVQLIQQVQSVSMVQQPTFTQTQVAVIYQILNNLHQFVLQQGEQLPQFFVQQVELAFVASQRVYQTINHQQFQVATTLYFQQLLQQIRNVQQYLHTQTVTPQVGSISLQLNQAFQIYSRVSLLSQRAQFVQPLNFIVERQLQRAFQSLNAAYLLAQQQGLVVVVQQLQNALAVAQRLQLNGSYQYQSQVGVSQTQVVQELVQYVEQQVAQGVLNQVQASYIVQQLQQIQYGVSQVQVQQTLQNVLQYVQQQDDISPVVVQHISQQIEIVLQTLNGQIQGQNYVQTLVQRYFNGPQQFNGVEQGQLITPYQFNGVQQGQLNTPYQFNEVQGQLNTPYQFNGVQQGQLNIPYQFNGVQQGQLNTPYQSYQNQGNLPLAYQSQYRPTAVAY